MATKKRRLKYVSREKNDRGEVTKLKFKNMDTGKTTSMSVEHAQRLQRSDDTELLNRLGNPLSTLAKRTTTVADGNKKNNLPKKDKK